MRHACYCHQPIYSKHDAYSILVFFLHDVEKLWSQSHIFSYTNVKKRKIYVLQKLITLVLEKYCKFQCRNWLNWFSCTNHKISSIHQLFLCESYTSIYNCFWSISILNNTYFIDEFFVRSKWAKILKKCNLRKPHWFFFVFTHYLINLLILLKLIHLET